MNELNWMREEKKDPDNKIVEKDNNNKKVGEKKKVWIKKFIHYCKQKK